MSDDAEREMLNASSAARTAAAAGLVAVTTAPLMSKKQSEREGDGTRGKTIEEIIDVCKGKLTPGQLRRLIEQVQKLRGERNENKDSRKK